MIVRQMEILQNANACAKQIVIAFLFTKTGELAAIGTNSIKNKVDLCPRGTAPHGVGYDLCKSMCCQEYHAETQALTLAHEADIDVREGSLILVGHNKVCPACEEACKASGLKEVFVLGDYLIKDNTGGK